MAGITHFKDLNKKGTDFLNDLLNQDLVISEKVDGSSFSVKKENDELQFYNRNENKPLSKIDRSILSLYEIPISHLESIDINKFDEGVMYSFEYFYNNNPVEIKYDYLPKNNLMLTNIKSNGKIITDPKILNKKAKDFKVDGPFIVFNGKLNKKQKEQILKFISTDFDELVQKFKTNSFTRFIISILNPKLANTALRNGIDSPIEGLVFKFSNETEDFFAKLVDPVFTQMAKDKKKKQLSENNDDYKSLLFDLTDFIKKTKIKTNGETAEERQLNLFAKLAINYYNKNKNIKLPKSFSNDEVFNANTNFITDDKLRNKISSNNTLLRLFQIITSGFRKTKKRASAKYSKDDIQIINKAVQKINKLIEDSIIFNDFIVEEEVLSFKEFFKQQEEKKENNALFLGRMQPPTKAHIAIIEKALKKFNKVYVAIIKGAKSDPYKNPFELDLQNKMIKSIFGNKVKLIEFKIGYIPYIINDIEQNYGDEITAVLAGTDRAESYQKQLDRAELYDVDVIEIPRTGADVSATELRNSIRENDYNNFKKNIDKRLLSFFDILKREIN